MSSRTDDAGLYLTLAAMLVAAGCAHHGGILASAELYTGVTTTSSGVFTAAGSMKSPRARYGPSNDAVVLPNGEALIAGEITTGGVATNTAKLYDPFKESFSVVGPMVTAAAGKAATLLTTGKVLYSGGGAAGGVALASAELYDPATRTFSSTGRMAAARFVHGQILLPTGKVLVVGGSDNVAGCASPSAELYDPASGTFTVTGAMVTCRETTGTLTLLSNGKILIAGGNLGAKSRFAKLNSAELYDPVAGTFTATGFMASPRQGHTATLLPNGKVLIAGGGTGATRYDIAASAELYDPITGAFAATGSMSAPRTGHSAVLLPRGKALIIGGSNSTGSVASAELYDPATGAFTSAGSMRTARAQFWSALLPTGKVFVSGGAP